MPPEDLSPAPAVTSVPALPCFSDPDVVAHPLNAIARKTNPYARTRAGRPFAQCMASSLLDTPWILPKCRVAYISRESKERRSLHGWIRSHHRGLLAGERPERLRAEHPEHEIIAPAARRARRAARSVPGGRERRIGIVAVGALSDRRTGLAGAFGGIGSRAEVLSGQLGGAVEGQPRASR